MNNDMAMVRKCGAFMDPHVFLYFRIHCWGNLSDSHIVHPKPIRGLFSTTWLRDSMNIGPTRIRNGIEPIMVGSDGPCDRRCLLVQNFSW